MKISSCYPMYAANDFSKVTDYLHNQQGYRILHRNSFGVHKLFTMESPDGYRVDVAHLPDVVEGFYATRINVDNFAEGYNLFASMGYDNEDVTYENPEMRLIFMVKEGAGRICLIQHIHEEISE